MRMAYWFGFAAVAGAFGGLIAFGVQHIHAHIANWRILFLIEGTPTIVLGILTMFVLPNRPEETSIFNEEERELAIARMNRGISGDLGRMVNKSASPTYQPLRRGRTATEVTLRDRTRPRRISGLAGESVRLHCDRRSTSEEVASHAGASRFAQIYAVGVIYFGANCALASISAFLPTIIATFGYSECGAHGYRTHAYLPLCPAADALAQLLTVPPYAVAAVFLCLNSYVSDRIQSRGVFVSYVSAVGALGYVYVPLPYSTLVPSKLLTTWSRSLLLAVPGNTHVRYFAVFCITSGTYTVIGIVIAWCKFSRTHNSDRSLTFRRTVAHNLGSETKRATGIPMYMAIGQCGSILGSKIYPSTEGPHYTCVVASLLARCC